MIDSHVFSPLTRLQYLNDGSARQGVFIGGIGYTILQLATRMKGHFTKEVYSRKQIFGLGVGVAFAFSFLAAANSNCYYFKNKIKTNRQSLIDFSIAWGMATLTSLFATSVWYISREKYPFLGILYGALASVGSGTIGVQLKESLLPTFPSFEIPKENDSSDLEKKYYFVSPSSSQEAV